MAFGILLICIGIIANFFFFIMRDEVVLMGVRRKNGYTWTEQSSVKCKRAPEFSRHAEICIKRID